MDSTTKNSLDLPIVSSCSNLSDTEKVQLAELSRRLVEPAQSLKEVLTEELVLPKILFEQEKELNCLFASKEKLNDVKLVSVAELLKSKLPPETVLSEGSVQLTGNLCKFVF